jgi:hypothetical protein
MVKKVIIATALLVVVVFAVFLFLPRGPDLSGYQYLKNPQIRFMENQKVLVVEAVGAPETAGGKAFGLLFRTYFKMKGTSKGPKQPTPRVRWPISLETPKAEWRGLYAMPVPEGITSLPQYKAEPGVSMRLETWEYGDVAEILHIGPYDREKETVDRLAAFTRAGGYEMIGDHEEEYLKGPGMFFRGDPEKYQTIIRYRVKKTQ